MEYIGNGIVLDISAWFFSQIGVFGHHEYFTKELWRKVPGFKDEDGAEVKAAFLHKWFDRRYKVKTMPVGSSWFGYADFGECWDKYMEKYAPVFQAYDDWCEKQR